MSSSTAVRHLRMEIDGDGVFYREAGPKDAPVLVLPHGYPCSSYEFRNLMPALADRWRTIAPDFLGSGYSDTPEGFAYDFDAHAETLERLLEQLGVERYAIWLHDFGGWIGLRMAMRDPSRLAALIIQNVDIYFDALGPKYAFLLELFRDPSAENRRKLAEAISEDGFREEFLNDVRPELAQRIPPDLWRLHWSLMTPQRQAIAARTIEGLKENFEQWFPRYQAFLREHRPPTLMLWGPQDGYMPEPSGRAYLRDLPDAELHMLDAGHWLLEAQLDEAVRLTRDFLSRVMPAKSADGMRRAG
ncbi:alpha/beta fold hydrolase [Phenylobacterium sp. VNQ135]|uniref:alpha/beta fold hydrolase n=1 Tax=Phenylobacterium sp. VNQ135 TaxID=3400922 RepID=UPI003BFB526D